MAIVVEENRNKTGFLKFVAWLFTLGLIAAAIYYIFLKNPEIVGGLPKVGLDSASDLSKIKLDIDEIANNPQFQVLKQHIGAEFQAQTGRENPFLEFESQKMFGSQKATSAEAQKTGAQ